jgi:hypothetical protein
MQRSYIVLFGLIACGSILPTASAQGQDVVPKVRYKGGHEGWGDDEIRGSLAIGDSMLVFQDQDGKRTLQIPLRKVTDLSTQTQRKEASVGSKLLFGGLARSRQEEFIAVSYELPDNAEAVIFRFEPHTSAAVLAKIKFRMKRLGVAATTNGESAPVTAAP